MARDRYGNSSGNSRATAASSTCSVVPAVIIGTRDQGTGTDASDKFKSWPMSASGPANKQACGKRLVIAALALTPIPSSHRVPPGRDASLVKQAASAGIGDAHP
jgi:hypothetical protein